MDVRKDLETKQVVCSGQSDEMTKKLTQRAAWLGQQKYLLRWTIILVRFQWSFIYGIVGVVMVRTWFGGDEKKLKGSIWN